MPAGAVDQPARRGSCVAPCIRSPPRPLGFAPPAGVHRLVIARDNDAEGERAAERLVRRSARTDVTALVIVPESDDFNSDLVALGPQALAARLAPILRLPLRAGE